MLSAVAFSVAEAGETQKSEAAPKNLRILCAAQSANIFRNYASGLAAGGEYRRISIESADSETIEAEFRKGTLRIAVSDKPVDSAKVKNTPIMTKGNLFAVNLSNKVGNLSSEQIGKIMGGKIASWAELGGDSQILRLYKTGVETPLPNGAECLACGHDSCEEKEHKKSENKKTPANSRPFILNSPDMEKTIQLVTADKSAFAPLRLTEFDAKTVKLISVDNIPPTSENLRTGKYPFSRILYLVESANLTPEEARLSDYVRSRDFAAEAYKSGMLPMKIEENTRVKTK